MKTISLSEYIPTLAIGGNSGRIMVATLTSTGEIVINDERNQILVFDITSDTPRRYNIIIPLYEAFEVIGTIEDYIVVVYAKSGNPQFRVMETKDDPISWSGSRYIAEAKLRPSWLSVCQIQECDGKRCIWYINNQLVLKRGEIFGHRFFSTDVLNLDPVTDKINRMFRGKYAIEKMTILKPNLIVLFYKAYELSLGISKHYPSETRYLTAVCDFHNGEILSVVPMKTLYTPDKGSTTSFNMNRSETHLIISPDRYVSYDIPEGSCFSLSDNYDVVYLGDERVIVERARQSCRSYVRQNGYLATKMGVYVIDPRPGQEVWYEISTDENVTRTVQCWCNRGRIIVATMEYNDTQRRTFLMDGIILESIDDLKNLDQGEIANGPLQLERTSDLRDSNV